MPPRTHNIEFQKRPVAIPAFLIGLFVIGLGLLGLFDPGLFVRTIRFFQEPPIIYGAAAVRVTFGVILVLAAPISRAPRALRVLGGAIVIGGLLTPFLGVRIGHAILEWWASAGPSLVRTWAGCGAAIGAFILVATFPQTRKGEHA